LNPANPRLNDDAVPHVAASLRRFGWRQPLVAKPSGEVIVLEYNANGYLKKITDFAGRTIEYVYDGPTGTLTEVVELSGSSTCECHTKYTYTANALLETVTSPEQVSLGGSGAPYLVNEYDDEGQGIVVKQTSGAGDYTFTYPSSVSFRQRCMTVV